MALLLKPTSPTPSNTVEPRSFQRDTGRGRKVLRYREVQQRGGANECLWRTTRVRRAGTYGNYNAPLRGCIGLLLILNSMHNTPTDRRWARLHSQTPPAKKTAPLTTLSSCHQGMAQQPPVWSRQHNYTACFSTIHYTI